MSKHIYIDRTLISKWKNGQRKIDTNNDYFEPLIEYLFLKNATISLNTLERLFYSVYDKLTLTDDEIKMYLKRFIIEEDGCTKLYDPSNAKVDRYTVPVTVYDGIEEGQQCILDFMSYALVCERTISILHSTAFDVFANDNEFIQNLLDKVEEILKKGITMNLIITFSHTNKMFLAFSKFLVYPNCNFYQNLYPDNRFSNVSIYVIENERIILGFLKRNANKFGYYSSVFKDQVSVLSFNTIVAQIMDNSAPILTEYEHSKFMNGAYPFASDVSSEVNSSSQNESYYTNLFPSYLSMKEDLLIDVLVHSGFSDKNIKSEVDVFRRRKDFFTAELKHSNCIHFYGVENLRKLAQQDVIVYTSESLISSIPIKLTREHLRRHLEDLAEFVLLHEKFNVCLTLCPTIMNRPFSHCWCKKNEFLCLFGIIDPSKALLSENFTFVNSFANLLEQCYMYADIEMKNPESVASILKSLANEIDDFSVK